MTGRGGSVEQSAQGWQLRLTGAESHTLKTWQQFRINQVGKKCQVDLAAQRIVAVDSFAKLIERDGECSSGVRFQLMSGKGHPQRIVGDSRNGGGPSAA